MARIVLDLDGTLVESHPTLAAAANALLAELGRAPVGVETCVRFVGHGVGKLVERVLEHTGGVPGELAPHLARYREIYAADPVTGTNPYRGVAAALDTLAAAGHGLAVCTQKPDAPALAILRGLALMPPVTGFTGGDTLGLLKPDPRMIEHAAGQLPPGPALMVGDSAVDAETARRARVPFLLYTEGYRQAPVAEIPHTAAFADFAELPALVAEVLEAHAAR